MTIMSIGERLLGPFMWGREVSEDIARHRERKLWPEYTVFWGRDAAEAASNKLEPGGVRYGEGPLTATEVRMQQMEVNARHQWRYDAIAEDLARYRRAVLQYVTLTPNPPMILKEEAPMSIKQSHIEVSHAGKVSGWAEVHENVGAFGHTVRRVQLVEKTEQPEPYTLFGREVTKAHLDIVHERARQEGAFGYTVEHDRRAAGRQCDRLVHLAVRYLARAFLPDIGGGLFVGRLSPTGARTYEPVTSPTESAKNGSWRSCLVKAAALLLAEIERIDANRKRA